MRITDLQAAVVKVPQPESLFSGGAGVRGEARRAPDSSYQIIDPYPTVYSTMVETLLVFVETDAGATGMGEAQFPVAPEAGAVLAERLVRPLVLGENPLERERLYNRLYASMSCRGHSTGVFVDVIAAVDSALWDLAGQAAGESVAQLLGGRTRDRVPAYVSGLVGATRERRVEEALGYRALGFRAVKIFGGHGADEDLAEAAALREALGPDVALCVDPQWMYDPPTAIRLGRGLERLGVTFFETPVSPDNIRGTAAVARALDLPVAGGECERTRLQFLPWLDAEALDLVQIDVGRCGITEARSIALLAAAYQRPVALHLGVGLFGYIAASLQLAAWAPNLFLVEYQPQMVALAAEFLEEPFAVESGAFVIPTGSGIGVRVKQDALAPRVVRPRGGRWRDVAAQ